MGLQFQRGLSDGDWELEERVTKKSCGAGRRSVYTVLIQAATMEIPLKGQERTPGRVVTDKLSSLQAAPRAVMPSVAHRTDRDENNRADVSHQPTRQRERHMRRGTSPGQHNDSCPCMDSSATSSALAVTWCERCIIGSDEDALFSLGMQSRSPPDAN